MAESRDLIRSRDAGAIPAGLALARAAELHERAKAILAAPRPSAEAIEAYEERDRQRAAQQAEDAKWSTPAKAVERPAPAAVGARPAAGAYLTKREFHASKDALEEALARTFAKRTADTQGVVDGMRSQLALAQQRAGEAESRLAAVERRLAELEAGRG